MDLIQRLRETRQNLWNDAKAVLDDADARGDKDLSKADETRYDALVAEMKVVDDRLREIYDAEEREADMAEQRKRMAPALFGDDKRDEKRDVPVIPSMQEYRALSEGTAGAGGYLVAPEQARIWLDYLRNQAVFLAAGPRVLQLKTDEFHLPKLAGSVTVSHPAENATITASDPSFSEIVLRPKVTAAFVLLSRQLWDDSAPVMAREMVTADLMARIAEELDNQFLRGDGTGQNMTGLKSQAGVNIVNVAATLTIDHVLDAISRLRVNKATGKPHIFMSARDMGTLRKQKASTGGSYLLQPDVTADTPLTIAGVPVSVTDIIPTNLGGGTNESEIYVVDMNQVVVGENMRPEVAYDESFAFQSFQVACRAICRYDVGLGSAGGVEMLAQTRP